MQSSQQTRGENPSVFQRLWRLVIGAPRDISDSSLFHRLALIPVLAWVGLGADGLSSSSYGPDEAFRTLGQHTYLAVGLAMLIVLTITIIASAYSCIIEEFPSGGGGYLVATKLLGANLGVISGCALIVDYVLTVTVSLASAGDAIFSMLPAHYHHLKLPLIIGVLAFMTTINIRGVKESVQVMLPIFILFLITHIVLIVGVLATHGNQLPEVAAQGVNDAKVGYATLGGWGMMLLFLHAYSLGGGTFTGLEAVSNGMQLMREPKVHTAKRTMMYMAVSLSFMAGGLLVCYLVAGVVPNQWMTLNASLATDFYKKIPFGSLIIFLTLISEGGLLVVGAQAGFLDGPRVLANMALDGWMPRRFSVLSERLTTQNGIMIMGIASLAALLYTKADVRHLVVMYSINVFVTFSLSMFAMLLLTIKKERGERKRHRRLLLFGTGFVLCLTILCITVIEKFTEGGWLTVSVTGILIGLCFLVRKHYRLISSKIRLFDKVFKKIPEIDKLPVCNKINLDPNGKTAVIMVSGYGGTGISLVKNVLDTFPEYFRNLIFISVGVVDSGKFKGADEIEALRQQTEENLKRYTMLGAYLGYACDIRMSVGIDLIDEAEKICRAIKEDYKDVLFFSGQLVFQSENWYHRLLHNHTSFQVQSRLQKFGETMVILPMQVTD